MKLSFCLIIWISLLELTKSDGNHNCVRPHFSQILSRKKRFLTFPSGSSFAVKRSFTKAILQNIPRGLSLTVDIGLYYPLPVSTDSWDLTKLLYRLDLSHSGGLSATPKPKKESDFPPKLFLKNDSSVIVYPINRVDVHQTPYLHPYGHDVHLEPVKWNGLGNYHGDLYDNSLNSPITFKDQDYIPLSWNTFQGRIHRNDIQQSYTGNRRRGKKLPHDSFESLESIFHVNIKACILRAICEFNEQSFPKGKSLIMDIAKIVFDVTESPDFDEFTGANGKNVNCETKRFLITCPHSPFEFFSRNFRLRHNNEKKIKDMFPAA